MLKGCTSTGFNYEVPDEALNNWEVLEDIDDMATNPQKMVSLAKKLLSEKSYNDLKEHCRDERGIVPLDKMSGELREILTSNSETKN